MKLEEKIAESALAPVGSILPAPDVVEIARDGWYQIITPSTGSLQGNEVILSRVPAGEAEAVVRRTIEQYASYGLPFKWCVSPLTEPADFGATLSRLGFSSWGYRGMAVEPSTWTYGAPEDVSVEQVTPATLDEYIDCAVRGWSAELSEGASWRVSHAIAMERGKHHFFTARVGGQAVGTAGMIVKPRSVYLVGGNVIEAYRGRGIYRALIDARLRRTAELGLSLATTMARESTSAPILERLGFETLYRGTMYKYPA